MKDKEIRSDSKLKGEALTEDQHTELWELRYPSGEAERLTLEEIAAVEVPRICGRTCSVSTLSGYYKWLRQKRDTEESIAAAEQAKLQFLKANPNASPESLHAVAQMVFTNKAMQSGDVDAWAKVAGIWERKKAREFNEKKFQEAIRTKLEAGLDALFEEIKGNEKAEAIFANLKGALEGA